MASQLMNWVNDELHGVLGYSDSATGRYLVALAKKSTDTEDFLQKLKSSGMADVNAAMVKFANQLMNMVPHAGSTYLLSMHR